MSKSSTCGLLGVSRQVYYRSLWSRKKKQNTAEQVVSMVESIRLDMPRIGFRKLYYLLYEPLKGLKVGRDKFLSILRANHMLIKPKRNYRITTDSHHRFRKHKNLIADSRNRSGCQISLILAAETATVIWRWLRMHTPRR